MGVWFAGHGIKDFCGTMVGDICRIDTNVRLCIGNRIMGLVRRSVWVI